MRLEKGNWTLTARRHRSELSCVAWLYVLKSGYEAKGDDVSSAEIFEQAVSVILGAETQDESSCREDWSVRKAKRPDYTATWW